MHARCQTDARYRYLLSGIPRTEWPAELQPVPKPAKKPRPERKAPAPRPRLRLPCINLGKRQLPPADPNGVACGCPGKEVWACDVHGRCTKGQAFPGVACCNGCPDYETDAVPFTKHLAYHIYPVSNGVWRWNVDQLRRRLHLFDGKRVVAVVTDPAEGRKPDPDGQFAPDRGRFIPGCDSFEEVVKAFGEDAERVEFIHLENDPHLREVATLVPMLERMPNGPRDVLLYAQAKGTTRGAGHVAHRWTEILYEVYLDYWPIVARLLEDHPLAGAFKKRGNGWHPDHHRSDWHYSGSWFWVRTADLFNTEWRNPDQGWTGIEPYPSQRFDIDDAPSIFIDTTVPKANLYSKGFWKRIAEPQLVKWKQEHEKDKTHAP